jgi:peptide-methionine (S)-S-oxide reductase
VSRMTGLCRALPWATLALVLGVAAPAGAADPAGEGGAGEQQALVLATFAGGCFWCMEPPFDKLDGVVSTTAGYAGGPERDPTYRQVAAGQTGHAEVVQVAFDPARISYAELLEVFWRNIDPFAVDRQFCDAGPQYRSGIFHHDEGQRAAAEASLAAIEARLGKPVATIIEPVGDTFHAAEDYHQDYYLKNPLRYRYYRYNCGRDRRLEQVWGSAEQ